MAEKKSSIVDVDDLMIVWKFLSKNWLIILLFPIIAGVAAYLYVHRMADEYGAKTEILLGSGTGYEYQSQIYRNLTGYSGGVNQITNQIRVLQSHDLISKTLDKLNFQISYYIVGRVKTTEIKQVDAFSVDVTVMESLGELFGVPFDVKILDKKSFVLSFEHAGQTIQRTHPFNTAIVENEYLLRLDRNTFLSDETFTKLKDNNYRFVVNSKNYLISSYKAALEIVNEEGTSILAISVKDNLASKAKMFLDTLSHTYIDYTIQSQVHLNENTLSYIDRQLIGITHILDSIETNLEVYKKEKDILDLSREQTEFFQKLLSYEGEKRQQNLKLETLESLEEYLVTKTDERLLPPALYITDDEFLKSSLTELYNMEVQRTQAAYDAKDVSPGSERIAKTIQQLRSNIMVYIKNLRKAIDDRVKDLNKEISYYENLLRKLPQSEREILNIERNLSVNEKMYVYLLEKKANTIIARAAIVPEVGIIEVARSIGVIGPQKMKIVYYFLAVGLLLSLIVAFVRSLFFDRIQNTRELKQITNLPILGSVPKSNEGGDERLVVAKHSRSNIAESFRSIRTNLQYFSDQEGSQTILLTSLHPGEGKTFCSINTAAIIASADKKVLLLDFDMHKPKVHQSLELNNDIGLSSFIVGKSTLEEVIQKSELASIDVITAGPVPPNASELVLSPRVDELLAKLKEIYDYIIIDTPPLMLISDSMVLMRAVDIGMFVMNTEKATRSGVRHLEEIVESNKLMHTALILNNVKLQKWRYYYGRYSYNYGYGYGYGYGKGYGTSNKTK
ncbi:polysaccharide biosynthesis tyrosine autokinase [Cryomorpha ignava]|uniref:non-specific protein-tyrosine kinase n=1 Tax=Cryomorpha ignava TaxID=101383 RepID=A0A7K3WQW3_9FLAO|nr:tyrosine-protein kinase [Cryomorpha ignava]NEN24067.1 polysaccharide biosynthesis tyrosine autokinase [Cryomorpha ignava]